MTTHKDYMDILPKKRRKEIEARAAEILTEDSDPMFKEHPKGQAKALAGSLRHYAKGKHSIKNIREITKRHEDVDTRGFHVRRNCNLDSR